MENVIVQGASLDDMIKRITSSVLGEIKPLLIVEEKKEDKRLSRRETSDYLGISDRTLDKLSKSGCIRFIRIGGRVMYEESDLKEYINKNASK